MKITQKLVALVGLAALAGAAYWVQNRPAGTSLVAGEASAGTPVAGAGSGATKGAPGRSGGAGGPAPVEVGRVVLRRLDDDVHAVGSLRSNQGVMMRPEVAGRIMKIGFQDGQRVRRGQLLIQLDDTLQQA